ncbi:ABC transporter permease [Paenibacillus alkalitolerans]|uniref:ABC transporter permease n=1 Tax=Paenibacillus alkalitolerans TaxID=2799335 RepID=UPI0018F6C6C8|nr:FtsX-like permease family protein [Paenibacillus alkalitolerans]
MIRTNVIWKMAWRNLFAQKRQTLLSLLGGSIGAMLIIASVVFFGSFDESGTKWLREHYGPIDWELTPINGEQSFSSQQVEEIKSGSNGRILIFPTITYNTSVYSITNNAKIDNAMANVLVIGINNRSPLLDDSGNRISSSDNVIVSKPVALRLDLIEGDVIGIEDKKGNVKFLKIQTVSEEKGISGYRGSQSSTGTILIHESMARELFDIQKGEYNTIFASSDLRVSLDTPTFPIYFKDNKFGVLEPKKEAISKVKQVKTNYGTTFLIASGFAVCAGLILMSELFMMLGDQRKKRFGALRALGFSRRHIRHMFMAETTIHNILNVLIGTVLGSLLGYFVVWIFYTLFKDTLQLVSSFEVPIIPYIPIRDVIITSIAILLINFLITIRSGYIISKISIIGAIRDQTGDLNRERSRISIKSKITFVLALAVVVSFFYMIIDGELVSQLQELQYSVTAFGLFSVFIWFLAPLAMLILFLYGLRPIQKTFSNVLRTLHAPTLPVILATRYPLQNRRRVLSVTALFSIVSLLLSMVITIGGTMVYQQEKGSQSANLMGYQAYVPFKDKTEKSKIIQLIENKNIKDNISNWTILEPYRLNVESKGVFNEKFPMSVVSPDERFVNNSKVKIVSKMPMFSNDAEVWKSLMEDKNVVLLHESFMYAKTDWDKRSLQNSILTDRPIKPGDEIELGIYPKSKGVTTDEDLKNERNQIINQKVKVLGFVSTETGNEFYNLMLVSSDFYETFHNRGFQWKNTQNLGYFMANLNPSFEKVQMLEEQFLLHGIKNFHVPSIEELANAILLKHTLGIYVGFIILSIMIGIIGLIILQVRAVHARTKQLGMLRCIGASKMNIKLLFLFEGSMIGWVGIINGWLFGSVGGYNIYKIRQIGISPIEDPVPFKYPIGLMAGIMTLMLLMILLLNFVPARRSVSQSPGIAVRTID